MDIGAVERQPVPAPDTTPPTLTLLTQLVNYRGTYSYLFVALADNAVTDTATVQLSDFGVTAPNGLVGTLVSLGSWTSSDGTSGVFLEYTPPGGSWDPADNGVCTVSLVGPVADINGNAAPLGVIGTFNVAVPVRVAGVTTLLPDGTETPLATAGQRSAVPAIRVRYDALATGADLAAAYALTNTATGATVALTATTATVNGRTEATLVPAALPDGRYTLRVLGAQVGTANAPVPSALDGDNNDAPGGDSTLAFTRYLGDFDGDTAVDGNDLAIFAQAFNTVVGDAKYRTWLDLDGDGAIDGNDLAIFAQRFNTVL